MDYGICMDGATAKKLVQAARKMQQLGWPVFDCDIAIAMMSIPVSIRSRSVFDMLPDQWRLERRPEHTTLSIDVDAMIKATGSDYIEKYKYVNDAIDDLNDFIDNYLIYYQE